MERFPVLSLQAALWCVAHVARHSHEGMKAMGFADISRPAGNKWFITEVGVFVGLACLCCAQNS